MIPTAEELFASQQYPDDPRSLEYIKKDLITGNQLYSAKDSIKLALTLTKLHVEAALKAASENAETEEYIIPGIFYVNKDSILNAYPLENIK